MRKRLWITTICLILILAMSGCKKQETVNEDQDIIIQEADEKIDEGEENLDQPEDEELEEQEEEEQVQEETSIEYPLNLWFSSGVGAWSSNIIIYEDGRFVGNYQDTDMGTTGEGYPNGTCYICDFSGKFTNIVKVSEYAYSLTLETISFEGEIGSEYIENQIRYVCTGPVGMTGTDGKTPAKKFMLYTPGTLLESLPEDFLTWWGGSYNYPNATVLPVYGLRNMETNDGFF